MKSIKVETLGEMHMRGTTIIVGLCVHLWSPATIDRSYTKTAFSK